MHPFSDGWGWFQQFCQNPPWYGKTVVWVISNIILFCLGWLLAKLSFCRQVKHEAKKSAKELANRRETLKGELDHINKIIGEIRTRIIDEHERCIKRLNRDFIEECRLRWFTGESRDFQNALADVHSNLKVLNTQLDEHTALCNQFMDHGQSLIGNISVKAKEAIVSDAINGTVGSISELQKLL
ncbi:MAG: hypothetical protein ABSD28_11010 [Tepidisphaeraceae bacterium]|jgi:hypothetical protein